MELKSPEETIVYVLAIHNAAVGLSLETAADALKGASHVSSAASSLKVAANLSFALKQTKNFDSILAQFNMSDERFELLLSEANRLASKQYSSELPLHMKHVFHRCQGQGGAVPKSSSPETSFSEDFGGGEEDNLSIHSIYDEDEDNQDKEYDGRPPGQDSLYLASSKVTRLDEVARIAEEEEERRAVAASAAAEKARIDEDQRREEENREAKERRCEDQRVSAVHIAAAAAAAQDVPLDEDKADVDEGNSPLSFSTEAISDLAIPIDNALSANNNFLDHIQKTRANGYPLHEFLAVGKFDMHTPFLLAVTDIVLMRREASDVEPVGRSFARLSRTTQVMIAEARKFEKKRKDREYVSLDFDAPAMDVLSALEKADNKISLPECKLCRAGTAAWDRSSMRTEEGSASKRLQWTKHTKYTSTTICSTLATGHVIVLFRVLELVSFSRLVEECSADKGDAAEKSKKALSLIRQYGFTFCDEDISEYTILEIFEEVILPAMHSHDTHRIEAIFVLSFLIEELVKAKRYGKEWRISERVRLSQTLEEAGGREIIEDMIEAEEAMLLPGQVPRSYFVEMKKGKKDKPNHTNNGSKRRRRSMRAVFAASSLPYVAKRAGVNLRHLVFSYLCSTVTNFDEDYGFLLDERLHRRQFEDEDFATKVREGMNLIRSQKKKSNFMHVNFQDMREFDEEDSSNDAKHRDMKAFINILKND